MAGVNLLVVLVAGIVHFAVGMIWYSPFLFAKMWMELTGVKEMKPTPIVLVLGILGSIVTAYVLANIVVFAGAKTVLDGVIAGVMVEIGFIATLLLGDMLFEKKPFKLFVLRNAYNLVALGITGAILAVWR
jgi:hypothetical protein